MRKLRLSVIVLIVASFYSLNAANAQNNKAAAQATEPKAAPVKSAVKKPSLMPAGMIVGTIVNVDTSDPANPKIEVRSDTDGKTVMLSTMPWTNVTKLSDISELKPGEKVRVMSRKMDNKDVAIGIIYGKMKNLPMPRPLTPPATGSTGKIPGSDQTSSKK